MFAVGRHYRDPGLLQAQALFVVKRCKNDGLGAPSSELWRLLCSTHGELEAARVVARLLGVVCEHGEDRVRLALEAAINQHRIDVLDLPVPGPKLENVAVPDALAAYVVEAGRASDYDHLLLADGAVHE